MERTLQWPSTEDSTVDPAFLNPIPQNHTINILDLPPTVEEVEKAINQRSSNKTPGMDKIPAEINKAAEPVTLEIFHSLLINISEEEDMSKDFKDATIIPHFKNKGSKTTGASSSYPLQGRCCQVLF